MDLMQTAIQLLTEQFKGQVSADNAKSALSGLMGDGSGGINISDIVSKMSGSGNMAGMVSSYRSLPGDSRRRPCRGAA